MHEVKSTSIKACKMSQHLGRKSWRQTSITAELTVLVMGPEMGKKNINDYQARMMDELALH
jgi:hypothetical protein